MGVVLSGLPARPIPRPMITDPLFYVAAVPAVALAGLSKGGFGGAFGFAAVPLMALVISPVQAAGLMLPILLVMDVVAVAAYRRRFDRAIVIRLLPAGLFGTFLGWLTASVVPEDAVRIVVGTIALAFLARLWLFERRRRRAAPSAEGFSTAKRPSFLSAQVWGTLAGYTSFVAHAGGPPYQTYVVPLRLDPVMYAGSSAIFFAILNAVKVVPYAALGQFGTETLATAAVLAPLAVVSTFVGVRIVTVIDERAFYRILVWSILAVAVKLIWDGVAGLV